MAFNKRCSFSYTSVNRVWTCWLCILIVCSFNYCFFYSKSVNIFLGFAFTPHLLEFKLIRHTVYVNWFIGSTFMDQKHVRIYLVKISSSIIHKTRRISIFFFLPFINAKMNIHSKFNKFIKFKKWNTSLKFRP